MRDATKETIRETVEEVGVTPGEIPVIRTWRSVPIRPRGRVKRGMRMIRSRYRKIMKMRYRPIERRHLNLAIFLAVSFFSGTMLLGAFISTVSASTAPVSKHPNTAGISTASASTTPSTIAADSLRLMTRILQPISQELSGIQKTVAGYADTFTTKEFAFTSATGTRLSVDTICVGGTCLNGDQLQSLVAAEQSDSASTDFGPIPVTPDSEVGTTTLSDDEATDTPAVIAINGANPAVIPVGSTYNDLGAVITGPTADLNLGIRTFLNGMLVTTININTTVAATDTIDYVVTDSSGLTSTSTRTVIVQTPVVFTIPMSPPVNANPSSGSSTGATTTGGTAIPFSQTSSF